MSSKDLIEWRHVDTNHGPADIGSRGCNTDQLTTWMYGQSNLLLEEDADSIENVDLCKKVRCVHWCKDVLRSRWTTEYIRSLRERHNLKHKTKELTLKVGHVVLI